MKTVQWILLVARSQKLNFISSKKKVPKSVLKGVTYIAWWKFSKSQDSEEDKICVQRCCLYSMKILEYQYQRSTSNCRDSCGIPTKYCYLVEVKVGLRVGWGLRSRLRLRSSKGGKVKQSQTQTLTTCLADKTNHPVERLSLNRSQCGSCSTKYDTSAGT